MFNRAHFHGDALFIGARFDGGAVFDQTNFGAAALFTGAYFDEGAWFDARGATADGRQTVVLPRGWKLAAPGQPESQLIPEDPT